MILLLHEPVEAPVDQTLNLRQMIAQGNYDYVDSDIIAERFTNVTYGWVEPVTMEFDFEAPYKPTPESGYWWKEKEGQSRKNPWVDAGISELLAFGEAYPDLQRVVSIVALNPLSQTHIFGFVKVPCLRKKHEISTCHQQLLRTQVKLLIDRKPDRVTCLVFFLVYHKAKE